MSLTKWFARVFNWSAPQRPKPQGFNTFILEPILTPSGLVDGPGDDTPDLDWVGDSDIPDLDNSPPDDVGISDPFPDDDFDEVPFSTAEPLTPQFDKGVFTVGDSGKVSIDFLYDGGGYKGQLAIFSLEGMEDLDGEAFITEAARRASSNSTEGYIVIQDASEGAKFSGRTAWEGNFNSGDYKQVKEFDMNPGDTFGVMLIPRGTVEQVVENPGIEGATRPLFSLSTANPNDAFHVGQIADVTGDGNTFVMEDLRVDGWTDKDYNDIIFQVRGATAEAVDLDEVIDADRDWRPSDMGQALIEYAKAYVNDVDVDGDTAVEFAAVPKAQQPLVGIIDTGFSGNNPDLDYDNILLGKDWVDGDDNPLLSEGEGNEHGTHIAGIIAAQQDNGIGIDGINDDAPLWVGRAVGSGKWAESLVEFVDTAKESGQPNAVVNLSLDLTQIDAEGNTTTRYEFTPAERAAIEYARQNNVLIVAAAGNDGGVMSVLGQASQEFDNIITIGAAEQFDPSTSAWQGADRTDYSSYGYGLDLMAYGGTIENPELSLTKDGVGEMAGTSVATAKVTGAVSQVWAANPELSYRQVVEILKDTATDLGETDFDRETGAGLLNMAAAIHLAKATKPEVHYAPSSMIPGTWSGEGTVTPNERAVATEFMGKYYEWKSYQIQSGDFLSTIAQRTMGNGSEPYYNFIAQHNGIANPNWIVAGEWISVPYEVAAPSPSTNFSIPVGYDGSNVHQTYINTFNRNGGVSSLGSTINQVHPWGDGYTQDLVGGSEVKGAIMKSNANDLSYWVGGDFWNKFLDTNGAGGILGYPTSDRYGTNGGERQNFRGGALIKSSHGIFPLYGGIGSHYLSAEGGETGRLGFPKSGEIGIGNGVIIQNFEHGRIVYGDGPTRTEMSGTAPTPQPSPTPTNPSLANPILSRINSSYFSSRPEFYTTGNIFHISGWGSNLLGGGWNARNNNGYGTEGNCTWYAHGRLLELGGNRAALQSMHGNANEWHTQITNGTQIVSSPQPGDIAQWSSNGNHVAVVEKVNSDGTIVISESHWDHNVDGGGSGTLHDVRTISASNPDRFLRVPGVQVQAGTPASTAGTFTGRIISTIGANVRSGPSTSHSNVGSRNYGETVTFDAATTGEFINYPSLGTATDQWYRIAGTDQWISAAIVHGSPGASLNAPVARPGEQQQYIIKSGDTLWGIADRFLGDGNRWREIMKSPNGDTFTEAEAGSLQPGQSVYLPVTYQQGTGQPVTQPPANTPSNLTIYPANFSGTVGPSIGVNVRNSPRFSDHSSRSEPYGKRLEFDAWTYGEAGTDMWLGTPDSRWFRLKGTNSWVPSCWIYGNPPSSSPITENSNSNDGTQSSGAEGAVNINFLEEFSIVDTSYRKPIGTTNGLFGLGQTERYVTLTRVNNNEVIPGKQIIRDKPTWIVIHGWDGKADNFTNLGMAIEEYDQILGDDQVLTLDWNAARTGKLALNAASTWIESVAQATSNILKSWGISSHNINLVGHSLGTYVSYEIAKNFGGINRLVAFDPAVSTAGGYPNRPNVDFSQFTQWSWAFQTSSLGSSKQTRTAHESFYVNIEPSYWDNMNPDTYTAKAHSYGQQMWAEFLRGQHPMSQYWGLEDIKRIKWVDEVQQYGQPWNIDQPGFNSNWEAQINVKDQKIGFGIDWVPYSVYGS